MAAEWIMGTIHNALAPTISSAVQTAGSVAGDAVSAVGNGINGIGESINSSIRRYGDGTKDYGNAIKDYTKAPGPRAATASNPLGLSTSVNGGRNAFSQPMYRAPAPSQPRALPAPKPKPQQKAPPTPATKAPGEGDATKDGGNCNKKPFGCCKQFPKNHGTSKQPPNTEQNPPGGPCHKGRIWRSVGGQQSSRY